MISEVAGTDIAEAVSEAIVANKTDFQLHSSLS